APADITLFTHPDIAVPALLAEIESGGPASSAWPDTGGAPGGGVPPVAKQAGPISMDDLAACFNAAADDADKPVTLTRLPFGWPSGAIGFEGPLDYLGRDGGAGVGSAPGMTVGAALAIRERGGERLPVTVTGDGEYIMGLTALWTAARYRLPMLLVVADNHSFYNDVEHQERMAKARNRPVENKFIGMEIDGPAMNLAGLARDQGLEGIGPIEDVKDLPAALAEGFKAVAEGKAVVIDVVVVPGRE
ncbi:MAG: thiamine pyrophosphate-dependent enzyme, partial [Alphaproteobacteria bacterium]